jgi:hypothetical protein
MPKPLHGAPCMPRSAGVGAAISTRLFLFHSDGDEWPHSSWLDIVRALRWLAFDFILRVMPLIEWTVSRTAEEVLHVNGALALIPLSERRGTLWAMADTDGRTRVGAHVCWRGVSVG